MLQHLFKWWPIKTVTSPSSGALIQSEAALVGQVLADDEGVAVEVSADVADLLGVFTEDALSVDEAIDGRFHVNDDELVDET